MNKFLHLLKEEILKNDLTVKAIFVGVLTFLLPLIQFIVLVMLLVFIDFVTGVINAKRLKMPISSKMARESIWKLLGYMMLIISSNVLNYLAPVIDWVKIICGLIAVAEAYSIGENLSSSTGFNTFKIAIKYFFKKFGDGSTSFSEIEQEYYNNQKDKVVRQIAYINEQILKTAELIGAKYKYDINNYKEGVWYTIDDEESVGVYIRKIHEGELYAVFETWLDVGSHHKATLADNYRYIYIKDGGLSLTPLGKQFKKGDFVDLSKPKEIEYSSKNGAKFLSLVTSDKSHFYKLNKYINESALI